MSIRESIVAEARTWLGTPFHHQGRIKGCGADCAGVVIGTARALGLTDFDTQDYPRSPSGDMMQKILDEHMVKISLSEVKIGDVLLFCFDKDPQHVGFYTDIGLLHSYGKVRKCIETSLDEVWMKRLRGVYRFKGLK